MWGMSFCSVLQSYPELPCRLLTEARRTVGSGLRRQSRVVVHYGNRWVACLAECIVPGNPAHPFFASAALGTTLGCSPLWEQRGRLHHSNHAKIDTVESAKRQRITGRRGHHGCTAILVADTELDRIQSGSSKRQRLGFVPTDCAAEPRTRPLGAGRISNPSVSAPASHLS